MALDRDTLDELLATVARFVREQCVPLEHRIAADDRVPDELVARMRALGLFGFAIPEAYGGLGLNMEEDVRLAFELGKTSPAIRSIVGTNNGIGAQALVMAGSEKQKQRYLPRLASGELISAFALTEPEAGSDAASLRTRATRTPDGYVLNGGKRFITNAPQAGLFTVFARTSDAASGADGISAFLVEAPRPGLSRGAPEHKMGQQGAHVCDVMFDDCAVDSDALLGTEGQGFKTAMKVLDRGRLHIAAICVGAAERLIDEAVRYARSRSQFGRPIGEFQLVQAMLADSAAEALAARCMVLDTARRRDRGEAISTEAACCKMFASEMVGRVADRAVQIFGGAGYIADYGIERFYRDVRLFRIYEGTTQIQQLVIARNLLKEARG
ncbi:MAG TPA: acyl-CoA dehydrogenase family protein [Pseudolabrys sp.]|nr:acyl-CoA dehydrogenase family protein [Pseudolabrys sp.]